MCHREAGGSSSRITNRVMGRANQIAIRPPKVILSVAAGRSLTDHANMSLSYTEPSMMNPPFFGAHQELSAGTVWKCGTQTQPSRCAQPRPSGGTHSRATRSPMFATRLAGKQIQLISTPTALPNAIPGRQTKTSQSEVALDWARYSETDDR